MERVVVLLDRFQRLFKLAWLCSVFHFAVFGRFTHATEIFLERSVFVLPLHHCLLSFEGDVVEGVVGEVLIVCKG